MATTLEYSAVRLLRTEAEYDTAVAEMATLMDQEPALGTPARDRVEVLTLLISAYDDAHYPMGDASTPRDVVDFLLEQNGMTRAQLAPLLGGRSRVSDFFNGVRPLSVGQVQALRARFGVSADLLLPRPAMRTEARRTHGRGR